MAGVIRQIDPALEEAGRVSGGGWTRVMRTITFPLVRSGLAAAWALLFMVSIREASTSVLLTGPNSPVLGPAILNFWNSGGLPQVSALVIVQATIILVVLGAMRVFIGRRLATS
jgi:iron(III) transport system permease protein